MSTGQYWYVSVIVAKGARPRNENGFSAVSRHAGLVFNRLLKPNTDLAIDFHTGTTGLDASAFHDDN
jgi:predicted deacylase